MGRAGWFSLILMSFSLSLSFNLPQPAQRTIIIISLFDHQQRVDLLLLFFCFVLQSSSSSSSSSFEQHRSSIVYIMPKIYEGNSIPISNAELATLIDAHPKPASLAEYSYGTAGFRYEAGLLPCVFVRMGIFSALRSASLGGEEVGQSYGRSSSSCNGRPRVAAQH